MLTRSCCVSAARLDYLRHESSLSLLRPRGLDPPTRLHPGRLDSDHLFPPVRACRRSTTRRGNRVGSVDEGGVQNPTGQHGGREGREGGPGPLARSRGQGRDRLRTYVSLIFRSRRISRAVLTNSVSGMQGNYGRCRLEPVHRPYSPEWIADRSTYWSYPHSHPFHLSSRTCSSRLHWRDLRDGRASDAGLHPEKAQRRSLFRSGRSRSGTSRN